MILGGIVTVFFGAAAGGKSLEDVATPLSVIAKPPKPSSAPATTAVEPSPSAGD
jgi:hypothetical protein